MFELSIHALERMTERNISAKDIQALVNSDAIDSPEWNEKHESWNFTGKGFTADDFTIACTYEDGTLIVTVFWD